MRRTNDLLQTLYEYDRDFFSYTQMASEKWNDLVRDAMKELKVRFDLENNNTANQQREIVIPQKEWEFTKCKFRCELYSAGGDWEVPAYYFRCQLIDGYAFGTEKYRNSGLFVFIPGKTEGNFHLVRSKNGEDWVAPDNNDWKKGIDPERNDRKCWEALEEYLKVLVDLEIEKTRSEREERSDLR